MLEEPLAALERVAQRDQLLEQVASQCLAATHVPMQRGGELRGGLQPLAVTERASADAHALDAEAERRRGGGGVSELHVAQLGHALDQLRGDRGGLETMA